MSVEDLVNNLSVSHNRRVAMGEAGELVRDKTSIGEKGGAERREKSVSDIV